MRVASGLVEGADHLLDYLLDSQAIMPSNGLSFQSARSLYPRRAAGGDLLSTQSTDHAPDPAIMMAAVIASTSK